MYAFLNQRLIALGAVLVIVLSLMASTAMADRPEPSVVGITYTQGSSSVDVVLAIPVHIYLAAQHANFGLDVVMLYTCVNDTLERIDSGRASIKSNTIVLDFDDEVVVVLLKVALGTTPPPGSSPAYTSTVELLTPGRK